MSDARLNFAVLPTSVRVFFGFRHADLDQDRFFRELGRTFMPGTPYMLLPLGLSAYLPAALAEQPGAPCPHEVALIAYPSPEDYRRIMQDTLRGRVYAQSHGGVYDRQRSRAAFPVLLDPAQDSPAIHLWDVRTDWQSGQTHIFMGFKTDTQTPSDQFRKDVRTQLAALKQQIGLAGIDQCIGAIAQDFVVLWTHRDDSVAAPFDWSALAPTVTAAFQADMQRVVCRTEPPVVEITTAAAFNFIFLQAPEWHLR